MVFFPKKDLLIFVHFFINGVLKSFSFLKMQEKIKLKYLPTRKPPDVLNMLMSMTRTCFSSESARVFVFF